MHHLHAWGDYSSRYQYYHQHPVLRHYSLEVLPPFEWWRTLMTLFQECCVCPLRYLPMDKDPCVVFISIGILPDYRFAWETRGDRKSKSVGYLPWYKRTRFRCRCCWRRSNPDQSNCSQRGCGASVVCLVLLLFLKYTRYDCIGDGVGFFSRSYCSLSLQARPSFCVAWRAAQPIVYIYAFCAHWDWNSKKCLTKFSEYPWIFFLVFKKCYHHHPDQLLLVLSHSQMSIQSMIMMCQMIITIRNEAATPLCS